MLKLENIGKINVCLMGMMGSGKSIIGKDLSKIYDMELIDIDYEIEKKVGKSISEIFSKHGEEYFRNIEEKICLKALSCKNSIISLGGGSIINKNIREIIKKNSFSIYLKVNINILLKRLEYSKKKRPLLKTHNRKEILEKLFKERKEFYNNADLVCNNNLERKVNLKNLKEELDRL